MVAIRPKVYGYRSVDLPASLLTTPPPTNNAAVTFLDGGELPPTPPPLVIVEDEDDGNDDGVEEIAMSIEETGAVDDPLGSISTAPILQRLRSTNAQSGRRRRHLNAFDFPVIAQR